MRHIELHKSAEVIVKTCLGCKPGEEVLVITDVHQSRAISELIMASARSAGAEASMVVMMPRKYPGEEPPRTVAASMSRADAVVVVTTKSITYSEALANARREGVRVLVAVAITEDIMARVVPIDYEQLGKRTTAMASVFRQAGRAHLRSPGGTELELELSGKVELIVDGLCRGAGEIDWVPAGSVHTTPLRGRASGKIVIDGSLVPFGILKEPVELTVENGLIVKIEGGREAAEYSLFLEAFDDPNVYNVGELGLGLNPMAKLVGAPIEDERIEGGVLIGIGQNILHGGDVKAKTHTDAIILMPTLSIDSKVIVENGKLQS